MKLIVFVLAFVIASAPTLAHAAEDKPVCIELSVHRRIAADLLELRGDPDKPKSTGLRGRVILLDKLEVKQKWQIADLKLAKGLAVSAKEVAQAAIAASVRGKREAEEERDAWHRSPTLWLAIGVFGALVIAVTVDKIQEDK